MPADGGAAMFSTSLVDRPEFKLNLAPPRRYHDGTGPGHPDRSAICLPLHANLTASLNAEQW